MQTERPSLEANHIRDDDVCNIFRRIVALQWNAENTTTQVIVKANDLSKGLP